MVTVMVAISLTLNALIVFPVSLGMLTSQPGMDQVFGPTSDARQILASVYLAIGLLSLVLLATVLTPMASLVVPMAVGLFAMQIIYKTITVATVGINSPVVLTNIAVIVVHTATLITVYANRPNTVTT